MDIQKLKEKLAAEQRERHANRLKYWQNRPPFRDEDEWVDIPVVDKEDYDNIIVPNLIRCGAIPKVDLIVGETYLGHCRNASEAVWDGEHFTYIRHKFGMEYPENINHFEDDNGFDLFVPLKLKLK